ncbi:MAG TPA: 4-hydroxythreonine-4-phosphate dehydrogenase PdxA [Steroidobacteraceae bacterium]
MKPGTPPRIALSSGEPAGIGPDLCLALAQQERDCALICLADAELLAERARALGLRCRLQPYQPGEAVGTAPQTLCVAHEPLAAPCTPGQLDVRNAPYVLKLIGRATDGCLSGEFAAMVTAPVQKSIIIESGVAFSGHTEFIAARCGAPLAVMLLVSGSLRVALATTHLALRDVSAALEPDRLVRLLQIVHHDLRRYFAIAAPRLGVCGLNPHAGEGGHLGDEEQRVIAPAIARAQAQGINALGPFAADTVFLPRHLGRFDVIVAMYHDQGLPVLKHAGFGEAVNVTLGLPIVRTSVDHGTALDLAGSGRAESGSLKTALELAVQMAKAR